MTERLDVVVYPYLETSYWYLSTFSSYNSWIAVNHLDSATELFFVLIPFVVLMGYSWSLASDFKSGYIEQLTTRASRKQCYSARFIATFLSAGTLVAAPPLVNFLLLALFLPSWTPSIVDQFYTGIGGAYDLSNNAVLTALFYTNPVLFVLARTGLDFVLCGLWATLVLSLSLFVRNRVVLVVVPYVSLLLLKHLGQWVYIILRTNGYDGFGYSITLFDQLRASPDGFFCPGWVTLFCAAIMFVIAVALPAIARKKDIL